MIEGQPQGLSSALLLSRPFDVVQAEGGTHATGNALEQVGSDQLDVVLPVSTELVLVNDLTAFARVSSATEGF